MLRELRWLGVKERIHFKLLCLMYKAVNGLAPPYLVSDIQPYRPERELRSSEAELLVAIQARRKVGEAAFGVVGPRHPKE